MFYIIEIQKQNDGSVAMVQPLNKDTRDLAEQAYHTALASAAVSQIDVHSVLMINDIGETINRQTYYHGQAPNQEA